MNIKILNIICYISIGLLGIYISIYQSVINYISQYYEINTALVGVMIAMHFLGSLTAPIIFGEISDRLGKKPVVILSFCILLTGLLAVYLFDSIYLIAAGIFFIGCSFAVIEGTLTGVLSDVNANQSGKVITISQMFFSIGAVVGPMASLLLIKISGRWKSAFLLMIVLFGITLVYFIRMQFGKGLSARGEGQVSNERIQFISIKLIKDKIFIYLFAAMFIYVGIEEGVAFWVNAYFKDMLDENLLGTYALSGYWASMILGRYLAGRFYTKRNFFLRGGLLLSLILIAVALSFRSITLSLICFIGAGLGFSAVWPAIMSQTADRYPEYTGTAMGMMMTAGAGGGMAIPFILGAIASVTSIGFAFWMIPFLIIVIFILQTHH